MSLSPKILISPKILQDFLIYSSSQFTLAHLYQGITPLFCVVKSLSLAATNRLWMVLLPLRCICIPKLYIRELVQIFGDRLKEHLRAPSPSYQHSQATGHPISADYLTIIGREAHGITRTIKEAMFICVNDPSFNRNLGKYQLLHIWDEVLQDISILHLK